MNYKIIFNNVTNYYDIFEKDSTYGTFDYLITFNIKSNAELAVKLFEIDNDNKKCTFSDLYKFDELG